MAESLRIYRERGRQQEVARRAGQQPVGLSLAQSVAAMAREGLQGWLDVQRRGNPTPDLLAGITVAAVALPLNLALAIACGLPPAAGLVAGAVGGAVAALLGGSALQVTGPAAALGTMVLAITREFGVAGVAAAALLVGLVQLGLTMARAGKWIKIVPESVLAGFTTGVGLKLVDNQLPELLGFDYKVSELAQMLHRPAWLHEVSWIAVLSGLGVAFLVVSTKQYKRFPAALVGVTAVTALSAYVGWDVQRVGQVPNSLPLPALPLLSDDKWIELLWAALPLGLIAAVESLLSAKAVDRMATGIRPHHPDLELFGQGMANLAAGLFGGMPVSGVIVRSGVNAQSGGRTRLAALVHAGGLLAAIFLVSEQIALVPLPALAGLLLVVAFRLIEVKVLVHLWHESKLEVLAFMVAAAGTLTGKLMWGLGLGVALQLVAKALGDRKEAAMPKREPRQAHVRAVVDRDHKAARMPAIAHAAPDHGNWLQQIRERASVAASAFVHNQATVIGRVVLGDHVHIAAGSSVRADEGTPFHIGANSNIQDGVVIHALKERKVQVGGQEWAVYVGENVSMAHDALVHGPCFIGDNTFVGFKAVVHDAIVGAHCFIGIGAVVVGVEVPDGRFVPHGHIVDSADKVAALPLVSEAQMEFNEDVVDVNRGLAVAYQVAGRDKRPMPTAPSAQVHAPSTFQPAMARF